MDKYQWLLLLHILAAFCFLSGIVVAGTLHGLAMRRDKPSDIALLLGMVRPMVALIGIGSIGSLAFGLWLAHYVGYGFGEAWVIAAIVLWFVSGALSGPAGKDMRKARELAVKLAAEGDQPSVALNAAVADRRVLILNYLSAAAVVAILVLMVFKPGAP